MSKVISFRIEDQVFSEIQRRAQLAGAASEHEFTRSLVYEALSGSSLSDLSKQLDEDIKIGTEIQRSLRELRNNFAMAFEAVAISKEASVRQPFDLASVAGFIVMCLVRIEGGDSKRAAYQQALEAHLRTLLELDKRRT